MGPYTLLGPATKSCLQTVSEGALIFITQSAVGLAIKLYGAQK